MSGLPGNPASVAGGVSAYGGISAAVASSSASVQTLAAQAGQVWTGRGYDAFLNASVIHGTHLSQTQQALEVASWVHQVFSQALGLAQTRYNKAQVESEILTHQQTQAKTELAALTAQLNADNAANAKTEAANAAKSSSAPGGQSNGLFPTGPGAASLGLIDTTGLQAKITALHHKIATLEQEIQQQRRYMQQAEEQAKQAATHFAGQMSEAEKMFPSLNVGSAGAGGGVFASLVSAASSLLRDGVKATGQFADGLWSDAKGLGHMAVIAAKLSPIYASVDPQGFLKTWENQVISMKDMATHPLRTTKQMADLKDLANGNVARWAGVMVPMAFGAGEAADGIKLAVNNTLARRMLANGKVITRSDGSQLLTMFGNGSADRKLATSVKNFSGQPGTLDVSVHGSPYDVGVAYGGMETNASAQQLAEVIKARGLDGQPIRLLSCSTGKAADGVAQQLADILGQPVKAPNDTLYIFPDGTSKIGAGDPFDASGFRPGGWEVRKPGGGS